jgi:monothiol glutaredoxin
MSNINQTIEQIIQTHSVVLFMKGTSQFPMCGFSGKVVQILKSFNIDFHTINVLDDAEIREGIKTYSNWPTIPQLYINQEFVGGCDIISDMYASGELQALFQK